MADGGGIEPLSSFPLFYATGLEDLCGDTTHIPPALSDCVKGALYSILIHS